MSFVARWLVVLLLGYLCMVAGTAVLAFYQSVWGESYYMRNDDTTQNLFDRRGRAVQATQLSERGLNFQNGMLLVAGQPMATYTDSQVSVFRPVQTSYWQQSTMVRVVAMAAALLAMMLAWQRQLPRRFLQHLRGRLSWVRPLDVVVVSALGVVSLLKVGVIDQPVFGEVVRGLQFGINHYVHDSLMGMTGKLTIFPYNPLSLLWMQILAVIDSDLQLLGVHFPSYALFNFSIFLAYLWLCLELVMLLRVRWQGSTQTLFLMLLLNPFGIYYTIFLGQIDVIAVALLVAGSRRVFQSAATFSGVGLFVLGLVFAKPQHALMLPALIVALFATSGWGLKKRVLLMTIVVTLACFIVYWLYGRVPAFAQSLTTNPQALRISSATWFQLFGDAVVINRPLAFMIIVFLVLAYRVRSVADAYGVWKVALLSLAVLTAWFQASYAHTFGISFLMYPAIMLMVTESEDVWRGAVLWLSSILLLIAWGTGAVGDASQLLGISLFPAERVNSLNLGGINYPSLLNTVETSTYIAFGVLLLIRLLGGNDRAI